ncbi:hypothetical protein ACU4GD_22915 [Cupriavidus basilensis]
MVAVAGCCPHQAGIAIRPARDNRCGAGPAKAGTCTCRGRSGDAGSVDCHAREPATDRANTAGELPPYPGLADLDRNRAEAVPTEATASGAPSDCRGLLTEASPPSRHWRGLPAMETQARSARLAPT